MNKALLAKHHAVWLSIEGLNRANDIVPLAPLNRLIDTSDNAVIKQFYSRILGLKRRLAIRLHSCSFAAASGN